MMLADMLSDIARHKFLYNEVWRWLALLGVLLVTFVAGKVAAFVLTAWGHRLENRKGLTVLRVLLVSATGPAQLLIFAGGLYLASSVMNLEYTVTETRAAAQPTAGEQVVGQDDQGRTVVQRTQSLLPMWINICNALAALAAAWFIFNLVDVIEYFLKRWTSRTESLLDDQLVPLVRKSLRVFVVIVAALFIAQNIFHWDVGALVAGLGIGGLAFALAAKDSLANLFGSVVIFSDRPFTMGERVKVGGFNGTVEHVGFRSTRIRTLEGHLVTIPNSVVANEAVENIGRRPSIRKIMNVTVTYGTPSEKLQRGVAILREMLDARRESFPKDAPPRVYFNDFNADSLNIVVYFWFAPPDWWQFLAFCEQFNIELLRRFNEEGIEFAFPTRTLYLKPDGQFQTRISGIEPDSRGPRVGT